MTSLISQRTTVTSYWLWAGCRIRITYNTRDADYRAAAFLKIDVLHPRGAALPTSPTGHVSCVLTGCHKLEADSDYVGYASSSLAQPRAGAPVRRIGTPDGSCRCSRPGGPSAPAGGLRARDVSREKFLICSIACYPSSRRPLCRLASPRCPPNACR